MTDEKLKVLNVIAYAIQMEIDGKRYYEEAGKAAINKLGKDMYLWLAGQEEKHKAIFEKMYQSMQRKEDWPSLSFVQEKRSGLKTLFAQEMKAAATEKKGTSREIEVIEKAKDLELKSRSYYEEHAAKAGTPAEKEFYGMLAAEEQGHYLTLVDYKEYLIDPAGYFLKSEHHSLDGG